MKDVVTIHLKVLESNSNNEILPEDGTIKVLKCIGIITVM